MYQGPESAAIVVPCTTDLYVTPASTSRPPLRHARPYVTPGDNALEVTCMANAELRVFESPSGHCVASPGVHRNFQEFLDSAVEELLDSVEAPTRTR